MQIVKYEMVYADDVRAFNRKVNALVAEGYETLGNPHVIGASAGLDYAQAMVIARGRVGKGLTRWVKDSTGGHWERMSVASDGPVEISREAGPAVS